MLKLPHVVIFILGAVLSVLTWVLVHAASGDLPIPAVWLGILSQAAIIVKAIVGIASDSPATLAKLSRMGVRLASGVTMAFVFAACRPSAGEELVEAFGKVQLEGCSPTTTGQIVQTIPPAVTLVECVYTQVDQCVVNHVPWPTCTAQTASACGTDVASVVSIWAAKRAAEAREGLAFAPNDAGVP